MRMLSLFSLFPILFSLNALADDAKPVRITLPAAIDGEALPSRTQYADCLADIKDVVAWGDEEEAKQAKNLCALRAEHARLKLDFVAQLQKLVDDYADYNNHGVNGLVANAALKTVDILAACVDANDTYGLCHNIACVTSPEYDHIACYQWAISNPAITRWMNK
jgi:hypothetical protein